MNWWDIMSATHGVFFSSQSQVGAWESVITKALPDLKKGEIEKALYESMERDERPDGFRVTAKDVIAWVRLSRNGWGEVSYVENGWRFFPNRERICGQIQRARAG